VLSTSTVESILANIVSNNGTVSVDCPMIVGERVQFGSRPEEPIRGCPSLREEDFTDLVKHFMDNFLDGDCFGDKLFGASGSPDFNFKFAGTDILSNAELKSIA
jgi:hypothetical protein